jgi:mannose-6-phosphate isomerase-like protein (cupin superfamily)
MDVRKVNLAEKFGEFAERWSPKIAGEVNDSYVKLVMGTDLKSVPHDFVWHTHENEDEMLGTDLKSVPTKGRFTMRFRDRDLVLEENEFLIVPRGMEHCPVAEEEAHVILFEPKTTLNTGNVHNERTIQTLDRI